MNKLEQAARQALEALEFEFGGEPCGTWDAITALREALAEQAEQEPVAWMNELNGFICKEKTRGYHVPLYAAPVRTKDPCNPLQDLTDDEIEECVHIADSECTEDACMPWFIEFARAVIAADREKNRGD